MQWPTRGDCLDCRALSFVENIRVLYSDQGKYFVFSLGRVILLCICCFLKRVTDRTFLKPSAWFSMCISNTKHQSKISCASKQLHFPTLVRGTSRMFSLNASLACFAAQQQKLTSHLCFISQDNLLVHLRENLHKPLSNLTINLTGLTEKLSVPKVPEICFMSDDSSPESMSSWLDKKFTTDTASPLLRCASCKLLVHASE